MDVSDWPQRRGGKKPESVVRSRVVAALKPLRAFAVENVCDAGTPDVALTTGWIEIKRVDAWPKLARTPMRLAHFTPDQRVFLREWCRAGGRAWVLLAMGGRHNLHAEGALLPGAWAADHLGYASREVIEVNSILYWMDGINYADLLGACR